MPDDEMGEAIFRQAFDLWINPEVERRRRDGRITSSLKLRAAQVVIQADGSGPVVRLNEEVRGIILASFTRAIEAGESVSESDIQEINEVRLAEEDGNAGHLTLLLHKGSWFIAFDFRYNGLRIGAALGTADEFLATAKTALDRGHLRAAVDNLFSATELCAKAMLLALPDDRLLTSKKHGFIASEFNKRGRSSGEGARFARLLNRLAELRPKARYTDGNPGLAADEVRGLVTEAEILFERARQDGAR